MWSWKHGTEVTFTGFMQQKGGFVQSFDKYELILASPSIELIAKIIFKSLFSTNNEGHKSNVSLRPHIHSLLYFPPSLTSTG